MGRDSAVGIATRYGLDGPGSNPEIFGTRPDRPWDPPSLLYNGYRVFPGGKAAGAWRWPPTPIERRGQGGIPLLPIWACVSCYRVNFTITFITSLDVTYLTALRC